MTKIDRANFGSKLGVILASAGSAVGLGNIWRFPYETGNHGGAAFILIYLGCVFLLGLPILIAEFLIGRRSRANTAGAYQKLAPGTHWRWVGRMGVLAAFLILSYYSVVAGWTLEYVYEALTNGFTGKTPTEFISSFQQFSSSPGDRSCGWFCFCWLLILLLSLCGERYREIFQDHDADSVHYYIDTCNLFGYPAGSWCGYRVSAETGFQQGGRKCI